MVHLTYNTLIVLAGTGLLGALAGALGTYMVLRQRALVGDALAHAALPGLALAFILTQTRSFAGLLAGATVTALAGAWLISAIRRHTRIKEDAAIGIVLSVLFGLGIVLTGVIQQRMPGGNKAGLDSFIFGKTAGMVASDVYFLLGAGLVVGLLLILLHKEFKLLSFDSGFATVQGWPVQRLDLLLMALVTVTTMLGLPAVGLVLMAALLIIPAAAARFWTDKLGTMLLLSAGFGLVTGMIGTLVSASVANLPTGPVVILCAAGVFFVSMLLSPRRGIIARVVRLVLLQRRIRRQNLLRSLYELEEQNGSAAAITLPALLERRALSPGAARRLLTEATRAGWLSPATPASASGEAWRLTPAGRAAASQVVRAHRLWEIFLLEEAQAAPGLVDRDAEQIEHILPADVVARLEARLAELGVLPAPAGVVPLSPPSAHTSAHEPPRRMDR